MAVLYGLYVLSMAVLYGLYVPSMADTNRIIGRLKWLLIKIDTFNEIYLSRKSELLFVIFSICNETRKETFTFL
jgi:hypothetical protein